MAKKTFNVGKQTYNKSGAFVFGAILLFFAAFFYWAGSTSTTNAAPSQPNDYSVTQEINSNANNQATEKPSTAATVNVNTVAPTATPSPTPVQNTNTTYTPNGTYQNVYGNTVARPYHSDSVPAGASAQCGDGSYSFSQSRSGTCSHHGGVADWL